MSVNRHFICRSRVLRGFGSVGADGHYFHIVTARFQPYRVRAEIIFVLPYQRRVQLSPIIPALGAVIHVVPIGVFRGGPLHVSSLQFSRRSLGYLRSALNGLYFGLFGFYGFNGRFFLLSAVASLVFVSALLSVSVSTFVTALVFVIRAVSAFGIASLFSAADFGVVAAAGFAAVALFTARKGKHAHSEASHTQSGKPCKFPLIHNTYPPKRASANIIL